MEPSNPTGHTTDAGNETLLDAMTQHSPLIVPQTTGPRSEEAIAVASYGP